ncbi:MAG: 50S ribosomal protein L10 [Candidatus Hydrogenedentales bacterium]
MARPEKIAIVDELKAQIEKSTIAIATQYQGITVAQATEQRFKLREQNVEFNVYKNTLTQRALDELGLGEAGGFMKGPTAWAFGADPVAPAKVIKDYSKDVDKVAMRGGILDGKLLTAEQLNALASLPSRDQLLSQVAGTIAMPLRNLLGVLNAVPRSLLNVLDQVRKQKEEQGAA